MPANDTLKLDADALDGFTSQLNNLMQDEAASMYPDAFRGGMGDGGVENVVADLASTDMGVGRRLKNYLTALAGLTGNAAKSTRDLDQQLADAAKNVQHGKTADL